MMKETFEALLTETDIKINGDRPWDIQVHDHRFYRLVIGGGSLALGESYMEGWWDCEAVDQLVCKIFQADLNTKIITLREKINALIALVVNWQHKARAFKIGKKHYDIGNDIYKIMLDRRMIYSCSYWNNAQSLSEAQEAKLELICQKIYLEPGVKILDVGCGWGGFAKYAAENYKATVTAITVSREQAIFAKEICQGLSVNILLQDYRDLKDHFDRIVTIGMIEHVGYKNYRNFFTIMAQALQEDGLFLLQTIGGNKSSTKNEAWIDKYIFPDSVVPSISQLGKASEELLIMEDWHNLGTNYEKTLLAWYENFTKNWEEISKRYDERFYRMWSFYLLSCAGLMRARHVHPWQIVFSKNTTTCSSAKVTLCL